MRKKLLYGFALSMVCMSGMAQDVPVADLLDVEFNIDGTATDVSPMANNIEFYGDGVSIAYSSAFERNVATFTNPWAQNAIGYYKVNFEDNETFRNALADGHSLEMLVLPRYEGTIQDAEAKPFSAMQAGGTGFLISTISGARQNEWTFLPNVTTSGSSTWRWTTSGVIPQSGFYYHVIGVWNKEEAKSYIYVNGELKNCIDAPGEFHFASAGSNWFAIGGDASGGGAQQSWNGDVIIARVYDKPLDGTEAAALWSIVEKQEAAANVAVFSEAVDEGRQYIDGITATQSIIEEYKAALDQLETLTQSGTKEEMEEQYEVLKLIRTELEASVAAYNTYNERVQYAINYLVENDDFEGDDRDYIEQYLNDFSEPSDEYPNGSYTYIWENHTMTTEEIAAETAWVDEKLSAAIENGYKPGADITNLLANGYFADGFNGWSGTAGTGTCKSNTCDYYGAECWARSFDMYQTLTGLENGVYVLSATAAYRPFDDRYSTYYYANMYANGNRVFLPTAYETRISAADAVDGENCYLTATSSDDTAVDYEISEDGATIDAYTMHGRISVANAANGGRAVNYLLAVVTDGTLTVGFSNPNPNASTDWTGIANIHLLYAGTSLEDADHYLDETLACMVARAQTIIDIVPEIGENYAKNPNCPRAIKEKLQAAIDAVNAASTPEEKYALLSTFTALWDEFIEGREAYVKLLDEAEICYSIASDLYKLTEDEYGKVENTYFEVYDAYEKGTYSTEEALAMEPLKALGLIPTVDENGVYQINDNFSMAYYALKAGSAGTAVNGKLNADIDFFTENQMMTNFYGELDGNFHTITVNIARAENAAALISSMQDGACVKNLTVQGTISTSAKFAAAIAANTYGVNSVSGITSLVNIVSSVAGDGTHAGIIGCTRGSTTLTDCVFAGTMEGAATTNSGGIVGWSGAGVAKMVNCLQIADIQMDPTGSHTFGRIPNNINFINCYYKTAFGEIAGTQITDEQLASGEVCYLLNGGNTESPTWFQTLGEDPYPVPNPSHKVVGKTADGTYTNDASQFIDENPQPVETTPKADLLDIVFHEDGSAEDVSPMGLTVEHFGETSSVYYNETYQRYVAKFVNPWGGTATGYYKADFEYNEAFRNALADGHSLEVLCMPEYTDAIPNAESKPFSAHQGGGTGFLISTISGARQNEMTFLPNVTVTGASTWRWTTSGVVPEASVFNHYIGVWNSDEGKAYIYMNGELKNTIDAPGLLKFASAGSNWFGVGCDAAGTSSGNAWNGEVAIARVYDKPLTQEDVTYLWNKVLDPTGIENVSQGETATTKPSGIFTINGIRVEKTQQGIYIINGKKILVK